MLEIDATDEEKQAIEELRKRTEHELTPALLEDKSLYYRFLKARDFDLNNAEYLLRRHFASRKVYGLDIIYKKYTPPEHIYKFIPTNHICFDKEGATVRYADFGGADLRGVLNLYTFKQVCQFVVVNLEDDIRKLTEQSKKQGKSITKFTIILDMDRLSLFTVTYKKAIDAMIEGFTLYQDNYPERIKSIYIINASRYFYIVFSAVKSILAGALIQKISVFGKEGWKETLLNIIDADQLPAFLGGNRTDPDGNPFCPSLVQRGVPVPEELIQTKKKITIANENGVKKLNITRFSSSEILAYVYEPNTQIEWEFETKNKDIGFGLYYRDSSVKNSKTVELIPKQRCDTMLASETGVYKCDKIGTYIIVFDNSYSWVFSKEIYYRLRLIKPSEKKETN